MLDDKLISELEQSQAMLVETLPPIWSDLYRALKKQEGLTEPQAWDLTRITAFAMSGGKGTLN